MGDTKGWWRQCLLRRAGGRKPHRGCLVHSPCPDRALGVLTVPHLVPLVLKVQVLTCFRLSSREALLRLVNVGTGVTVLLQASVCPSKCHRLSQKGDRNPRGTAP